ncbi:aromatic ring-hydroxylating oxygenase subunit alpha [Sneathiella glossodoripedis]|uniref:aromatic ring-hydroxylating oxygenase subunit alpha n=1 Tax=Sneathiella glossodoripedis TaxID=418853 RepID=UPI00046FE2D2|nr:SRPBCC family protein [Sneathiella glossodoripedis]
MKREKEIELLKRCAGLLAENSREMADEEGGSRPDIYLSQDRFEKEMKSFERFPLMVAHSSQLPENGSYLALDWLGGFPLLLTRDMDGEVHAFANACQHRGSPLAQNGCGQARRLMCPYHAWTYDMAGQLKSVPHKSGFPSLDPTKVKLSELHASEFGGFIWVQKSGDTKLDVGEHLAGLGDDLKWINAADHVLFAEESRIWNSNWKFIVEGGLESYHFKIAHRDTIAPLFNDTLSVFDEFGPHFRSVLTKTSLKQLQEIDEENWQIRETANVLYSFYPSASLLLQPDHFAVIDAIPLSPSQTHISVRTFVPKGSMETEKSRAHWQANFDFTRDTLLEDFELAVQIQKGLQSGATKQFRFGRFENALTRFHQINEQMISKE